jgi:predicted metallopeptidase
VKFGCKKPLDIDDLKAIARVMGINKNFDTAFCITESCIRPVVSDEFEDVRLEKILKLISILEQTK